jgi:hypothetical protein
MESSRVSEVLGIESPIIREPPGGLSSQRLHSTGSDACSPISSPIGSRWCVQFYSRYDGMEQENENCTLFT